MSTESENGPESPELRILRMMKKVLTDVAKDTYTPPALRHPLSESTINGIRECLVLISARENELAGPSTYKPRFVDEPQDTVVVQLSREAPADETGK
ncbi:MAG TPA: segregation and condensation protein A [Gammaproteobacteria bacterium]|nr:segregation and condensation protein A [Gammaproteobacteria bacterium]